MMDSVYALWELFNPAHMVKRMSPPLNLDTFFDCGANDVSGRMVESLVNEELGVGLHSFALERGDLVPGMYIIVLKAGSAVETRNCILLRQ